ncbi:hypothetical protein ANAPC5_01321 [Anaplasma phagocytophilum]|nr:hypothetical protein ANAPC5_01321 [Anaplasma phagocytophilum]
MNTTFGLRVQKYNIVNILAKHSLAALFTHSDGNWLYATSITRKLAGAHAYGPVPIGKEIEL